MATVFLTTTTEGGATMSELLTDLGSIGTWALNQIPSIGSAITDTPVLALGLGFFLIGGAIGIFGRLLHRG